MLMLGSCIAAPPATPTRKVAAGAPEPVASPPSSGNAKSRRRVRVEVSAAGIAVDGVDVGSDQAALKAALLRAGGVVIDVRAKSDASAALVLAALTVDAGPQVARRRLRWQDVKLKVSEDQDVARMAGHAWIFSWRVNGVDSLWSMGPEPALTNLGPFEVGDPKAEPAVIANLTKACAPSGCRLGIELRDERLLDVLRAWQGIATAVPRLRLQVRSAPPLPDTLDSDVVSGRLPPEVIQSVVRTGFKHIRICYEAGLDRNPKLQGRISVRFVIERDGTVKDARDGGSDLPDMAVRDCVMNKFFGFKFPPPAGGIVTVVYPIMLAPG
jgi:hypothetical protein